MPAKRFSQGQRLLFAFIVTILAPGLLLAVFGARALWQERQTAERQMHERLDRGAEVAVKTLADEFARLQALVDGGVPPETAFSDFPKDEAWAYVKRDTASVKVYPPGILPYELNAPSDALPRDPELVRAGRLAQQSNHEGASAAYRELLAQAPPDLVPEIKHGLARALRETGHEREAIALWREVESAGGRIRSLPADLVAGFEIAAVDDGAARDFYRRLKEGRWRLEKVRYRYYLDAIQERIGEAGEDDPRFRLAEAVEQASALSSRPYESGNELYVVFRRATPFSALVVSREFLNARVWPRVLLTPDTELDVSRIAINGHNLYSTAETDASLTAPRTVDAAGLSLRVDVQPKDVAGFYAALDRRTNLYGTMLAFVVVLLALGGYFIARSVRRELEVARMKSEFVSTVSHEFRAPLTGIRQLGEMLARDRVTDEQKRHRYYELILRESERLARLVENVLDFSRMEEGRKQYRFEPLDTASWLTSVVDDFQPEASRSGFRLETNIPDNLPAVSGDREALSTALRNLLDNACKYSPDSRTVWLDAEAANGGVCVSVRDRGVGIPVREQQQIFEKFYRGAGELSKRVKGVGLGLSLVQRIVEAHQGQVHVDSREGEGSTFSIHLGAAS